MPAYSRIADHRELIIYFRGNLLSQSEWLSAFSEKMVEYPLYAKAKVNKYFWDQFRHFHYRFSSILGEIEKEGFDDISTVTFVGHGMGAVYATFVAHEFHQFKKTPHISLQLFTYGQPRIGNRHFARALDEATDIFARVTYKNDIVVNLPIPKNKNYLHPMMEYWIESDNCDCDNNNYLLDNTIVYRCHGKLRYYLDGFFPDTFLDESEECAQAQRPLQFSLNNGPYFGITMGVLSGIPPWMK
ncbi:hypothetical protein G9A89_008570 [Geosiphon pyriformis]|nr:hypothetical protein G9A89_008570 [Geosiphon pyriformis]